MFGASAISALNISKSALKYPICVPWSRVNSTFAIDAGTGNTFLDVFETRAAAYRARPIFCNGSSSGTFTIASCKVSCPATLTTLDNTAGNWTTVTLPSGGVVPVAVTNIQRRGLLLGDWTDLANTSDRKFVAVRSFIAAGAGTITIGSTDTTNLTNWVTRTDGRSRLSRNQATDGVTTLSNFTSTTDAVKSPCIGIQYDTPEGIITVMKGGDSVDAGRNTATGEFAEESWWDYAALNAAAALGIKVEIANFSFASTDYNNYPYHIEEACAVGLIPDIACFPIGSPNGISTGITDTQLNAMKTATVIQLNTCRKYGIVPVMRTWIPADSPTFSGSGSEAYGADDAKRIAWNNTIRALKNKLLFDADKVMFGGTDGTGQAYMIPVLNTDRIHPNRMGNVIGGDDATPTLIAAMKSL